MRRVLVASVLSGSLLVACAAPYATPVVEEGLPFRGVTDYLDPDTPVRLVLTHGMCSGNHRASGPVDETNWVGRRAQQIAAALGLSYTAKGTYEPASVYPEDGPHLGLPAVERYEFTFGTPEGSVVAHLLVWGRHMDAYRENLAYDSARGSGRPGQEPVRATLNHRLRAGLMNDCLVDAVVYLGESGDGVRDGMQLALCDILEGAFPETAAQVADRRASHCLGAEGFGGPTVLAPESLGSTILFDAFTSISPPAARAGAADVRSIFLVSNQLPLLLQGNVPDPPVERIATLDAREAPADTLSRFLDLIAPAGPRILGDLPAPIELVALTDPNDMLGYRISPEIIDRPDIALRNVLVSNTPTWFGVLADPIAAHETARPEVYDLIVQGSP